jgi:hypothetical protein
MLDAHCDQLLDIGNQRVFEGLPKEAGRADFHCPEGLHEAAKRLVATALCNQGVAMEKPTQYVHGKAVALKAT